MKNRAALPRVFYLAFGGVSFLLLIIAAILFYFDQRAANQFTRLEGTVIRNQFKNGMARPIISYSWEGKDLTYAGNAYTNPPAFDRGDRVELFVNPSDPTDVWVNSFVGRYLAMTIVGGIGLFFLGFLALFRYLWNM
jgi:hypothetical protein